MFKSILIVILLAMSLTYAADTVYVSKPDLGLQLEHSKKAQTWAGSLQIASGVIFSIYTILDASSTETIIKSGYDNNMMIVTSRTEIEHEWQAKHFVSVMACMCLITSGILTINF